MKAFFLSTLRLAGTLLLICAVVAGSLAGVNAITAEKIDAINREKTQNAVAAVLPGVENPEPLTLAADRDPTIAAVYRGLAGDTPCYAVEVHPNGFGGEIAMMVGVDATGAVLGVSIIRHTETAGLGAVAAADTSKGRAFREQFSGCTGALAVTKDGGSIDAISSATVTSRAVTQGVNTALAWVADFAEEG